MEGLLDEIDMLTATQRTTAILIASILGVVAGTAAIYSSSRAARNDAGAVAHLAFSAWRMDLNVVLQGWTTEEKRSRPAKVAIVLDTVAELALATTAILAIGSMVDTSEFGWLQEQAEVAAWLAVAAGLLAVVNLIASLRIISQYETEGRLWWLGASLSLTTVGGRLIGFGGSLLWVIAAVASHSGG